ncbi:hypothetical protein [Shewanella atlantica]|uniref:ABC transporter substrate-binding protein n=1 Tax=Shewanella atlantica TaxID=271099 RepID=A0A431WCW0_9GAMM|nr:hypothetical protein [Shewanella atlantica]RTR33353.1 hypothetical protein EKG39_06300 [Shewanella atlantica]
MAKRSISAPLLLVISVMLNVVRAEKQPITVWNYYLFPPFQTAPHSGLATDFVALLNQEFEGEFRFKLNSVPSARLNKYLKKEEQGVLLVVNWAWMGEGAKQKYL